MQDVLDIVGLILLLIWRLVILPAVYAIACMFAGAMLMGPMGQWLGLVIGVIGAALNLRLRRRRGWTILYHVEQAVRLNLPLTEMLDAAAESEWGRPRWSLKRLQRRLESGESLGEALQQAAPEVDRRAIRLIIVSQNTGQLAPTLRWLLNPADENADDDAAARAYVWLYPVVMIVVMSAVIIGFAMLVLPKFQAIFEDFDMPLPAITRTLLHLSAGDGLHVMMLGSMAAAIALWLWVTWATFCPQWLNARMWPGVDALMWYTPIVGSITRDRDLRDVMRMLGSATAAGLSLETALTETMQLHVNTMTRRRLLRWRAAIESGATVDEAARRASLPRLVSGMLATVRKTNQLPRAIEYLGRYYEDKFSRAAALAGGAVVPAIELFFGVLVAWIALAAITPLFTLLNALTGGGT